MAASETGDYEVFTAAQAAKKLKVTFFFKLFPFTAAQAAKKYQD